MSQTNLARPGFVIFGIFVLYLVLCARLFYWQVIRSQSLSELARKQSLETLEIPALRGQIFASDNFPLATNTISHLVYANPKLARDKKKYSDNLAKILGVDPASISAKLTQNLFWVKLAENLDPIKKEEIAKLNLPGIGFEQQYTRFYPEASMAAHLIGFVGRDDQGRDHGYFGIEGEYNSQLSGRDGAKYGVRDALGNEILGDVREVSEIDGRTIRLTLDRTVQYFVDTKLAEGVKKYGADGGSAVVLDSETGAVLAMASYPTFNPEKYYEADPSTYKNPVLSSLYEPGSTFKVLVMASAIDLGRVKSDTRCTICAGPIQMGEYKIKTWDDKYNAGATMNDVIVHSDNVGMVFVGQKIGVKNMVSYLKRFGLGSPTGIDLQGEATGVVREPESWYPIDLATVSFGQGVSLTPIQLTAAVNSLANDGEMVAPYVVSQIMTPDGKTIDIRHERRGRTVSAVAAKTVTSMMVNAVEYGEAKWTKIPNYKIAGKTGTAQIPLAGHYDPNQTVASFVGFFPASKPKITMLVLLNHPTTSIYGSETAAPIFFNIARDLIKYYNLPPTN